MGSYSSSLLIFKKCLQVAYLTFWDDKVFAGNSWHMCTSLILMYQCKFLVICWRRTVGNFQQPRVSFPGTFCLGICDIVPICLQLSMRLTAFVEVVLIYVGWCKEIWRLMDSNVCVWFVLEVLGLTTKVLNVNVYICFLWDGISLSLSLSFSTFYSMLLRVSFEFA